MRPILATTLATMYGLTMHLLYGFFDAALSVMSLAFMGLVPVLIGFITVILAPKKTRISNTGAFFRPWATTLILLFATIALSMEGAICWIMVYPFFAVMAGLGGLWANSIRRKRQREEEGSEPFDWEKRDTLRLSLLALVLPLFTGFLEGERSSSGQGLVTTRSVLIDAPPEAVWAAMEGTHAALPRTGFRVSTAIGFPRHLRTESEPFAVGARRRAIYEKGLVFDETVTQCVPARALDLAVHIDPKKVPPTVLDEHIVIGGKHVQVEEDRYRLEPLPGGRTRLSLASSYRIYTPFNWYAGLWSRFLMGDILGGELALVKARAEIKIQK
ncbi:SRPBCC family protein [Flaviaesturariibacter amylovorans]|uniref:SRPBCC family protein n=1 Tax=Flaviaesturariibacter amylovorans TaxID=1084520 RepID=A0ABP8G4F9_9BACT